MINIEAACDFSKVSIAYIYCTFLCNLKCRHCITDSSPTKNNHLDFNSAKLFLQSLSEKSKNITEINVTGGEPFLYPNLIPLISEIKNIFKNIELSITTNGTQPCGNFLEMVYPHISSVIFSVDGFQKEHDFIRGHGAFEETIHNINKFISFQKNTSIKINIMRWWGNEHYIEHLKEWLFSKFLIEEIREIRLLPAGRGKKLVEKQKVSLDKNSCQSCSNEEKLFRCRQCNSSNTVSIFPGGEITKCHISYSKINTQLFGS